MQSLGAASISCVAPSCFSSLRRDQRHRAHKISWRIASAGASQPPDEFSLEWEEASGWKSGSRKLRAEIRGLRRALERCEHTIGVQDAAEAMEIERLVVAAFGLLLGASGVQGGGRAVGDVGESGGAPVHDLGGLEGAREDGWGDASVGGLVELSPEGTNKNNKIMDEGKNIAMTHGSQGKELPAYQTGLSTGRRLKKLDVHNYVHSALRESHLRSWLQNRGIAE